MYNPRYTIDILRSAAQSIWVRHWPNLHHARISTYTTSTLNSSDQSQCPRKQVCKTCVKTRFFLVQVILLCSNQKPVDTLTWNSASIQNTRQRLVLPSMVKIARKASSWSVFKVEVVLCFCFEKILIQVALKAYTMLSTLPVPFWEVFSHRYFCADINCQSISTQLHRHNMKCKSNQTSDSLDVTFGVLWLL